MKNSLLVSFVLVLILFSNQFINGAEESAVKVSSANSELSKSIPINPGIKGTRLYAFLPGTNPNHVIEFYEFQNGITAVHETKPADDGSPLLTDSLHGVRTLVEKFRMLCPSMAVPQELKDADERVEACANAQVFNPGFSSSEEVVPMLHSETPGPSASQTDGATSCSPDFYHDGWGGIWFINTYMNWYPNSWKLNQKTINFYANDVGFFFWRSMNGDFYVQQLSQGYIRDCFLWNCYWTCLWSYKIKPRYIEIWNLSAGSVTDSWWTYGFNICGHAHYLAEWF